MDDNNNEKTLAELIKENKEKRQNLAFELRKGMTDIGELKEVINNLFSVAVVEEDPESGEIIIHTGMKEVDMTLRMPNDSEDMTRKGDLIYMAKSEDPKADVRPKGVIGQWGSAIIVKRKDNAE